MLNGQKVAAGAAVVVILGGVLYYSFAGPKAPSAAKPSTAATTPPVQPTNPFDTNPTANPSNPNGTTAPTLTLAPATPGSTAGVNGIAGPTPANGSNGVPSSGFASNARGTQPGFPSGSLGSSGAGKGDLPASTPSIPGAANQKELAGGNATSQFPSRTGAPGTPPRLVNGFPASPSTPGANPNATNPAGGLAGNFQNGTSTTSTQPTFAPGGPSPLGGGTSATGSNGSTGGAGSTANRAAGTSGERLHVVASGETMSAIARKYLGSDAKWEQIAKANPAVDPKSMKIGTKLRIPAQAAPSAEGSTTLAGGNAGSAGALGSSATATASTGPGGTHVVAEGDTLSSISSKHYGSSKFWQKIAEANPSINPNNLRIGQKLKLPARTAVVGGENVER